MSCLGLTLGVLCVKVNSHFRVGLTMLLSDYLAVEITTKAELSRRLGVSKVAVSKWVEIPEKHLKVLMGEIEEPVNLDKVSKEDASCPPVGVASRDWRVEGEKIHWQGDVFGHGSEWDYNYSASKILHIRELLRQMGSVDAVFNWLQPVQFGKDFIDAVKKDLVCPIIVDMVYPKIGDRPIPKRVYPFGENS